MKQSFTRCFMWYLHERRQMKGHVTLPNELIPQNDVCAMLKLLKAVLHVGNQCADSCAGGEALWRLRWWTSSHCLPMNAAASFSYLTHTESSEATVKGYLELLKKSLYLLDESCGQSEASSNHLKTSHLCVHPQLLLMIRSASLNCPKRKRSLIMSVIFLPFTPLQWDRMYPVSQTLQATR